MKKIISIVIILTLTFAGMAWSQELSRVATAAGQFLKLSVGARAAALGDAFVGFTNDVASLYWNPAGIANIERTSLLVTRTSLYADISHNFVGIVIPAKAGSAVGVSVTYLSAGEIEITTLREPNGTGTYYDVRDLCVGLTYGRYITDRLILGITAKLIQEGIYRETARTVAIDFGSILNTGLLGIKLGMSLTNFGGEMKMEGEDLRVEHDRYPQNPGEHEVESWLTTEAWPLPMTFRMGIATDLVGTEGQLTTSENNRLTLAIDAFDPRDALLRSNLGLEYEWNRILALRVGYHGLVLAKDEYGTYDTASYTFGGGLRYNLKWTEFQFDYALTNFGILGNVYQFALGLRF